MLHQSAQGLKSEKLTACCTTAFLRRFPFLQLDGLFSGDLRFSSFCYGNYAEPKTNDLPVFRFAFYYLPTLSFSSASAASFSASSASASASLLLDDFD